MSDATKSETKSAAPTASATKLPTPPDFTIEQPIKLELIRNLLCCAFEGGSNYWYLIEKAIYPPGLTLKDYHENGRGQDGKSYWRYAELLPTQEGGALIISSKDGDAIKPTWADEATKEWTLDRAAIQRGLKVMAEKYPRHFGNFMSSNEDAETGDVFLQVCLFGEVVYG